MNTLTYKNALPACMLAMALFIFSSCSSVNNDVEQITEEDIEVAAQVVGESVSDEQSGLMSNIYDGLSDVSSSDITYAGSTAFKGADHKDHHNRGGRGAERNFRYEYDPETGIHTIKFSRSISNPRFAKSVEVENQYIFRDAEDNFIEFPKENKNLISSIYFVGDKSGESSGPVRSSEFSRVDTLEFIGLLDSDPVLTINGSHYGVGSTSIETERVNASRSYEISFRLENVALDKAIVEANGSLEEGVTGTVFYSMTIIREHNGETEEKFIEGEIDLQGDGTALLRFDQVSKVYKIFLETGEVEQS